MFRLEKCIFLNDTVMGNDLSMCSGKLATKLGKFANKDSV